MHELEASIKAYAETGLNVMITELDISVLPRPGNLTGAEISQSFELQEKLNPYKYGLPDSVQLALTEQYKTIFELFIKYSDTINRVTFWGVHDGVSWKNNWPVRGRTNYPLIFDRNLQPKPAFYEIVKIVDGES
jgi:endo-1,4-beta-xylanase